MGDGANMADIERFMRSNDGKKHLEEIRSTLKGRSIVDVIFENQIWCVATELQLDDGETFVVFQPSLEVDAIREEFAEILDEEYYKDYPTRRSGACDT